MSILVDGDLEAAAGIFLHIHRLTPQVTLSILIELAHSNEDNKSVLDHLMRQLSVTDPGVTNSIREASGLGVM